MGLPIGHPLHFLSVPRDPPTEEQLVRFHLSIPMGYVKSAALFCTDMELANERVLTTLPQRNNSPPHPVEALTATTPPWHNSG